MKKEELHRKLHDILEELEQGNIREAKIEIIYLINQVGFM